MRLLMPAGAGAWSKVGCTKELDLGLSAPEDALWSPRGDRVVMPTYVVGWLVQDDPTSGCSTRRR